MSSMHVTDGYHLQNGAKANLYRDSAQPSKLSLAACRGRPCPPTVAQ
jgi:hypothetical protein